MKSQDEALRELKEAWRPMGNALKDAFVVQWPVLLAIWAVLALVVVVIELA